jgi:flagellar basal body-associated protein FliL
MDPANIQEDDKDFSGNELGETEDAEDSLLLEEEGESKNAEKEQKGRKRVLSPAAMVALSMVTLCILAGMGLLYFKKTKPDTVSVKKEIIKKEPIPSLNRVAVSQDQLFALDSFIIPVTEKKGFTYFFLSICFNMPNRELKEEIIKNESALRGIIFDRLKDEISKTAGIPPMDKIKQFISVELNKCLSNGVIKELYVTEFLAV